MNTFELDVVGVISGGNRAGKVSDKYSASERRTELESFVEVRIGCERLL